MPVITPRTGDVKKTAIVIITELEACRLGHDLPGECGTTGSKPYFSKGRLRFILFLIFVTIKKSIHGTAPNAKTRLSSLTAKSKRVP